MEKQEKKGMNISIKSFVTALVVIFILMVAAYVLTFVIPGGQYVRVDDGSGNLIITADSEFRTIDGGIPFWKWILSPFLVLGAPGSALVLAVIAFLLVIGGVFEGLAQCGLMQYMLDKIAWKYGVKRYTFLTVITFFFMAMGALIGSFEECIPLVPIVVALALSMGWDKLTGLGMSLLAGRLRLCLRRLQPLYRGRGAGTGRSAHVLRHLAACPQLRADLCAAVAVCPYPRQKGGKAHLCRDRQQLPTGCQTG